MINKCVLKYYSVRVTEPPFEVANHRHEYWEMVYYDGNGVSVVNGVPFNYLPGTYVLIPSNVPHAERADSRSDLFVLGFELEVDQSNFPSRLFFDDDKRTIRGILETIGAEIQAELPYFSERINLLMREIVLLALRTCTSKTRKSNKKLDMIVNYIDTYFTSDIDFQALANSMNYSYDHLRHYFKAQKNMSLKQYIIAKRINLAKEKLAAGMPVAKAAALCGFASPAYFSATFRKLTGMTPVEYQRTARSFADQGGIVYCEPEA